MSIHRKQQYIITVMLVQIALDTHELVPSHRSQEMSETEKQLSVLVGDYYSGLYYYLLARLEDVDMIRVLATAIKNINEQKMILFYGDVQTTDELFDSIQQIESLLFNQVATFINVDERVLSIITELLMINRLSKEKELIQQEDFSYVESYVRKNMPNASSSSSILIIEKELEKRLQRMDELLLHLPYHFVVLKHTIRNKMKYAYNITVAEEG